MEFHPAEPWILAEWNFTINGLDANNINLSSTESSVVQIFVFLKIHLLLKLLQMK